MDTLVKEEDGANFSVITFVAPGICGHRLLALGQRYTFFPSGLTCFSLLRRCRRQRTQRLFFFPTFLRIESKVRMNLPGLTPHSSRQYLRHAVLPLCVLRASFRARYKRETKPSFFFDLPNKPCRADAPAGIPANLLSVLDNKLPTVTHDVECQR